MWDLSIKKILKATKPNYKIRKEAVQVLGRAIDFLIESIARICLSVTKHRICVSSVIETAFKFFFSENMYSYVSGFIADKKNNADEAKGKKRIETKFGLEISVSKVRKLFKSLVHLKVSSSAVLSLAAALDYVIGELIELSCNIAQEHKKTMLSPSFIAMAIHTDEEFTLIFKNFRIPGVVCYDRNELAIRKSELSGPLKPEGFATILKPYYTSEAVSLLKYSKNLLPKAPFSRLVRTFLPKELKISSEALSLLQKIIEDYGYGFGKCAVLFTYFAKRRTLEPIDIEAAMLVRSINVPELRKLTINKPSLKRLLRKANAAKISSKVYLMFNSIIQQHLKEIMRKAILVCRYNSKKTLSSFHIRKSLAMGGVYV